MRRPKRYRWLTVSVFLVAYSVFHAVLSAKVEQTPTNDKTEPDTNDVKDPVPENPTPIDDKKDEDNKNDAKDKEITPEDKKVTEPAGDEIIEEGEPVEEDIGRKKAMKGVEEEEEGEKKKQKDAGYEDVRKHYCNLKFF